MQAFRTRTKESINNDYLFGGTAIQSGRAEFQPGIRQDPGALLHAVGGNPSRDGRAENYVTPEFAQHTYRFAVDAIDRSDAIVAILNGVSTDSGACIEMGYAKGKGKLVFGVRTDFRGGEDRGQNVMVSGTCTALIVRNRAAMTLEDLAEEVADVFAKYERSTAPACIPFQPIEVLERRSV